MISKSLEKKIYKAFRKHISKDDLKNIINNTIEEDHQEILGVIIQFNTNKITISEFNNTLKEINKLGFIVAGIIGTYIFAYKISLEEFDFKNNDFVINKKIITFRTSANIQYCGVKNIFNYVPFFITPNEMFDYFRKIDFGNIYNLGKIDIVEPLIAEDSYQMRSGKLK